METPPPFTPEVPPVMPQEEQPKNIKRPTLLTVLCIISFIGGFFYFVMMGIVSILPTDLMSDIFDQALDNNSNPFVSTEELKVALDNFINFIPYAPLVLAIKLVSIVGVIMMFAKKAIGFGVYAVAQIAIISVEASFSMCGVMSYILTAILIILYFIATMQLKKSMNN